MRNETITIRVTNNEKARWRNLAANAGLSVADLVRASIGNGRIIEVADAVAFANQNDDMLLRHTGGFWAGKETFAEDMSQPFVNEETIQLLVTTGIAFYSHYMKGPLGKEFPIAITLRANRNPANGGRPFCIINRPKSRNQRKMNDDEPN